MLFLKVIAITISILFNHMERCEGLTSSRGVKADQIPFSGTNSLINFFYQLKLLKTKRLQDKKTVR